MENGEIGINNKRKQHAIITKSTRRNRPFCVSSEQNYTVGYIKKAGSGLLYKPDLKQTNFIKIKLKL